MRTVLFLVWKEYLHVVRDRATLFQVLAIPLVQLVVLSFTATFEIRDTRIHLIDHDRSTMSRGLVDRFEGSGRFTVVGRSPHREAGEEALLSGRATMVLTIPTGFERDIARDRAASVAIALNAEQGASAGIVRSYAGRILAAYAAELSAGGGAGPSGQGVGRVAPPPIEIRTRGWYNPTLDYTAYMVPGILVALVTLIGTLMTAQNIAREKEIGTLEQLNVAPITRWQFIAGKLLPFWMLAMAELGLGLGLARVVFDIPMRGSLLLVFAIAAVYLVAALAIGLLISTIAETQQQAMFVTFFVMMVYLLLSGLYTPLTSMPTWAQWIAELTPVKHFVLIMRAVLVKGATPLEIARPVVVLVGFALLSILLAIRQHARTAG